MRELLLEGRFSNIKIICQGVTFNAHRAVVCTQSSFFNGAFSSSFRESIENTIEIHENTPETIERVLSFPYLKEYDDLRHTLQFQPTTSPISSDDESHPISLAHSPDDSNPLKNQALNNIHVFVTADKFGIMPLKSLALTKFSASIAALWDNPLFSDVAEAVMTLVPPHETSLQEVIALVIVMHFTHITPAMMNTVNSSGSISSLVITMLIRDERIREPGAPQELIQKLNSTHHCRHCSADINESLVDGEYQCGIFRCVACRTRH